MALEYSLLDVYYGFAHSVPSHRQPERSHLPFYSLTLYYFDTSDDEASHCMQTRGDVAQALAFACYWYCKFQKPNPSDGGKEAHRSERESAISAGLYHRLVQTVQRSNHSQGGKDTR